MRLASAAKAARACVLLAALPVAACSDLQLPFPSQPAAAASAAQPGDPKVQTAALRTPAAVRADPNRLIGADRGEISGLLGQPGFVRRDRTAQMWRYIADSCVLDLYMYPIAADSPDATARVRHYDVRSRNPGPITSQACVAALLARVPSTS
jgi:hypothetical protein